MNTAETVILVSIFNIVFTALVGGIVIYVVQKKIDAAIQKSLFEYQTKFLRTYPKTLEILEALHKKFGLFINAFIVTIREGNDLEVTYQDASEKLKAFRDFCDSNRLYLTPDLMDELNSIYQRSFSVLIFCHEFIKSIDYLAPTWVDHWAIGLDFQDGWFSPDKPRSSLGEFVGAINEQGKRLEKLYKSVANIE